MQKLINIF